MNKYCLLLCLFAFACSQPKQERKHAPYKLVKEDYIYAEVFDSTYTDPNRYTDNNEIYTVGRAFVYDFSHVDTAGEKLSFKEKTDIEDWAKAWQFCEKDDPDAIKQVIISSKSGLSPFIESIPDYNQTVVKYEYPSTSGMASFNSMSGVIENEKNLWVHPPRDKFFRILELNPFPFIQAPYEIGNSWEWYLQIGSSWGDERWKSWEGVIENTYQYTIKGKESYATSLGKIEAFEVYAEAESSLGKTYLTALFSPVYGFIDLDYTNIDGSKTHLELVEVREGDK
ncbi:MAG: hypothetical protein AAF696_02445 [Bacteroidota bacterium]